MGKRKKAVNHRMRMRLFVNILRSRILPKKSIQEEFTEAETGSKQEVRAQLKRQNSRQEQDRLSAGDPDATRDAGSSGDETVGGSNPTPDQDNVDELGEAAGLTFEDSEELEGEKIYERDTHRWELIRHPQRITRNESNGIGKGTRHSF